MINNPNESIGPDEANEPEPLLNAEGKKAVQTTQDLIKKLIEIIGK